jgi:hypothetical protein
MCGIPRWVAHTHGCARKATVGHVGGRGGGSGAALVWPGFDIPPWVLFEVRGRTRQMAEAGGVSTPDRTFLKMAL